jgi:acylphosphatase
VRQRREIHYSGHVQGVGFRYSAKSIAERFAVVGYVQNLPDGRVKLVAEGTPAELDNFLASVKNDLARFIGDQSVAVLPAQNEFQEFEIRA